MNYILILKIIIFLNKIDYMKRNSICNILYRIFSYEIPLEEIYSFMYFLKGCGAYEKFINNLDINNLKYNLNYHIYISNKQIAYFKLISISFVWSNTNEGTCYWAVINDLHQIILYNKTVNKKLNFNDIMHDVKTIQHPKIFYNDMFNDISLLIDSGNIKDKNLTRFINCLTDYVMKNI